MTSVYVERRGGKIIGFGRYPIVGEDGRQLANQEVKNESEASAEIEASKPSVDRLDFDNVEKDIRALAIVLAQWNGKTVPQLRAAFRAARASLP